MQLLTTTRVYDLANDDIHVDFKALLADAPLGVEIVDGNAGLGADWPAGIWKSANAIAIALAVFSAPSTIEDNWPVWKSIYDEISQKMLEFHGEFRIDRDSAQIIAMHHAVSQLGLRSSSLQVHMAIRQFFSTFAGFENLLASERTDMYWPEQAEAGSEEFSHGVRSNEEAARQARCRYLFGIDDGARCITLCVEQDGKISFDQDINMDSSWG